MAINQRATPGDLPRAFTAAVLAKAAELDAHFIPGIAGRWSLTVHYSKTGDPHIVKFSTPEIEIVLDTTEVHR